MTIAHDKPRFTRVYHLLVALLILGTGTALLSFGIWLSVHTHDPPFNLDYSGSSFFNIILNGHVIALILGAFFISTAILSLIALSHHCYGKGLRIAYVIMSVTLLTVLILTTIVSAVVIQNSYKVQFRQFVQQAWKRTGASNLDLVCELESSLQCRGFSDMDCIICKTGFERDCFPVRSICLVCPESASIDSNVGCYGKITGRIHRAFLPIAVVAGLLSALFTVDVVLTACL